MTSWSKRYGPTPREPSEAVQIARAKQLHHQLLKLGAWCKHHQKGYAANHVVNGRIEGQGCPRCADDREWARKAAEALKAEGVELTEAVWIARAEAMAGHRLLRYHPYGVEFS